MSGAAISARNCSRPSARQRETPLIRLESAIRSSDGVAIALSARSLDLDEDVTDVSCALRSKAEVGPSARTQEGALLERWLAQCGVTRCTIHDRAIVRIWR